MSKTPKEKAEYFIANPTELGHALGYKDFTDLHGQWIKRMVTTDKDMTLQAHRGSFKTTCLCMAISLLMLWQPCHNIIFLRKTDNDVAEVIKSVNRILNTDIMRQIYLALTNQNLVVSRATSSEITLASYQAPRGAAQLLGIGVGGSLTGKHADIIITDDIVNLKDRISQAERERTKSVYMELQNIKNRGGRFINTGTPWHKDDAFTLMPNPVRYPWNATGLITPAQAEEIKSHMTNSLFAANYELKHVADDDVIFANPQTGADMGLVMQGTSHVDAAFYGEDYTAFTIVAVHDGKYYVYGKCWRKHIDNVMGEIIGLHNQFNCGKLYNERNADKGYVAKELRKLGARVVSYDEHQNKFIKIVSYLKFAWKDVIFVEGTDPEYIEQICDYNEDAPHDDCPDSLSSLIRVMGGKSGTEYQLIWNM